MLEPSPMCPETEGSLSLGRWTWLLLFYLQAEPVVRLNAYGRDTHTDMSMQTATVEVLTSTTPTGNSARTHRKHKYQQASPFPPLLWLLKVEVHWWRHTWHSLGSQAHAIHTHGSPEYQPHGSPTHQLVQLCGRYKRFHPISQHPGCDPPPYSRMSPIMCTSFWQHWRIEGREWGWREREWRKVLMRTQDWLWWSGAGLAQKSAYMGSALPTPFYTLFSLFTSFPPKLTSTSSAPYYRTPSNIPNPPVPLAALISYKVQAGCLQSCA